MFSNTKWLARANAWMKQPVTFRRQIMLKLGDASVPFACNHTKQGSNLTSMFKMRRPVVASVPLRPLLFCESLFRCRMSARCRLVAAQQQGWQWTLIGVADPNHCADACKMCALRSVKLPAGNRDLHEPSWSAAAANCQTNNSLSNCKIHLFN